MCVIAVSVALVINIKSLLQEEEKKNGFEKDVGMLWVDGVFVPTVATGLKGLYLTVMSLKFALH